MIIDGKAIAEKLYAELMGERAEFPEVKLGILVGDSNPVTQSYVAIKEQAAQRLNVTMVHKSLPDGAQTADAVLAIKSLAEECDGVIPQLPMTGVDIEEVLRALPKEKDVDVLSPEAYDDFQHKRSVAIPPVAAALAYILLESGVDVRGKKVVSLGRGRLVGKPAAVLFEQMGARVELLGRDANIAEHTKDADIVILGAGVPGILKPDMIKEGVVILDAGTSELGGKVVGDAVAEVAEKASLFTPVPGGVGPVAIAEIFKNLFALKRLHSPE